MHTRPPTTYMAPLTTDAGSNPFAHPGMTLYQVPLDFVEARMTHLLSRWVQRVGVTMEPHRVVVLLTGYGSPTAPPQAIAFDAFSLVPSGPLGQLLLELEETHGTVPRDLTIVTAFALVFALYEGLTGDLSCPAFPSSSPPPWATLRGATVWADLDWAFTRPIEALSHAPRDIDGQALPLTFSEGVAIPFLQGILVQPDGVYVVAMDGLDQVSGLSPVSLEPLG